MKGQDSTSRASRSSALVMLISPAHPRRVAGFCWAWGKCRHCLQVKSIGIAYFFFAPNCSSSDRGKSEQRYMPRCSGSRWHMRWFPELC